MEINKQIQNENQQNKDLIKKKRRINKIDKPLVKWTKRKRRFRYKIRDEKGAITTDTSEKFWKSLALTLKTCILLLWKNLKGVNEFLDINDVTKLYQDEINNLSWSITSSEIEAEIKSLRTKISPGPDGFVGEFHQVFKELLLVLLKIGEEGTWPKSLWS